MPRVTLIGEEFLVSEPGTQYQSGGSAASLPDGRFLAVWEDGSGYTGLGSDPGVISARLFDAQGNPLGDVFTVNPANTDREYYPRAVALSDGRFLITWYGHPSLEGQIVNADGTKVGAPFLIAPAYPADGNVAALPDGGFVSTWHIGNESVLHLQKFNADGSAVGGEVTIGPYDGGTDFPTIAELPDGRFAVVWTDIRYPVKKVAQEFDLNMNLVGGILEIEPSSDPHLFYAGGSIAQLDNGRFVIAWTEDYPKGTDTDGTAIRAQVFEADGSPVGPELEVNTTTAGRQVGPSVASAENGQFVIIWSDETGVINGQMYSAALKAWDLTGTSGDDYLEGDRLDDTLSGTAGDDRMWGLGGNDLLDGGDGSDTADYSEKTGSVTVTLKDVGDASVLINGVAEDTVRNIENLIGGSGQNKLTGNASVNVFVGGDAQDVLVTLGGDDTAYGEWNNDYLYMGAGDDLAFGEAGVDVLLLDAGNDYGYGGDSQDYIFGGEGNDYLFGEGGVDVLQGEDGDDYFDGGEGSDYFYGGTGNDVAWGGLDDPVTQVVGNDIFVMGDGNDEAYGETGQDYFYMGNGDDYAAGGAGVDVFLGGSGNDFFDGGEGVDYAWGEAGNDGFILSATNGVLVVQGFAPGGTEDALYLAPDTFMQSMPQIMRAMTYYPGMNTTIFTIDGDTSVWLVGVNPSQLTISDFYLTG